MNLERWKQIDKLFDAALEIQPDKRSAFLDEACAGDTILKEEIESLLASDQQPNSFLEAPAVQAAAGFIAGPQTLRLSFGESVGPYRIVSLLGAGGMGEVYHAIHLTLERDVAIKVLPEHLAIDRNAPREFEREAKALAALSHPNILAIFDFGTHNGMPFAVMELLNGETLRDRIIRSPLGWDKAVEIGTAIAEGLAAAHSKSITHRDLKPENIFLTSEDHVKILDFGLARWTTSSQQDLTKVPIETVESQTGIARGTIPYMSPEQVRGDVLDTRTDIFSFGSLLYEMVTGRKVFLRGTPIETMSAILNADPPEPLESEIPNHLWRVIARCLEKNSEARFASGRDLVTALKAIGLQPEHGPLIRRSTENQEAFNLYLKGRYLWGKRYQAGLYKGIEYFQKAIQSDPDYALAFTGLADSYSILGFYGNIPAEEARIQSTTAARKALQLDNTLSESHTSMGFIHTWFDWNVSDAQRELRLAIELNPRNFWAHAFYGFTFAMKGKHVEAEKELKRALALDPLSHLFGPALGFVYQLARRYDEAIEECRKVLELEPNSLLALWVNGISFCHKSRYEESISSLQKAVQLTTEPYYTAHLAYCFAKFGKKEEAQNLLVQLHERSKSEYITPVFFVWIYGALGEMDLAFDAVEKAYAEHHPLLAPFNVWEMYDSLRSDPRFEQHAARICD